MRNRKNVRFIKTSGSGEREIMWLTKYTGNQGDLKDAGMLLVRLYGSYIDK